MGFLINCDNKGCCKLNEPVLDVKTNKAYCSECKNEIKSITVFAKTQMKALGQTLKNMERKTMGVHCGKCDKQEMPVVKNGKAFCKTCNSELNVTKQFMAILKNMKSEPVI